MQAKKIKEANLIAGFLECPYCGTEYGEVEESEFYYCVDGCEREIKVKQNKQNEMHEYLNKVENKFKNVLATYVETAKEKYLRRCKKHNFNQKEDSRVCVFFYPDRHTGKPRLDWSYVGGQDGRFSKIGKNGMVLWSYGLDEHGAEVKDKAFEESCKNKDFYITK